MKLCELEDHVMGHMLYRLAISGFAGGLGQVTSRDIELFNLNNPSPLLEPHFPHSASSAPAEPADVPLETPVRDMRH